MSVSVEQMVNDAAGSVSLEILTPVLERVCRTHHWIKQKGKSPSHRKGALTDAMLQRHLTGGEARGACPMNPGESTTRLALLDLDSHDGAISWSDMVLTATHVYNELERQGFAPTLFRSRGGDGVHIFLLWDQPQDARSVRCSLRNVLGTLGYSDGTGGVAAKEIEVFPKQDTVKTFGNMFVLPFSGKSAPFDELTMDPTPGGPVNWRMSAPVPIAAEKSRDSAKRASSGEPHGLLEDDIREMLANIKGGDRNLWLKVCWAMRRAWHAATAFIDEQKWLALLDAWSSRGDTGNYQSIDDVTYTWEQADGCEGPNIGTLWNLARDGGWSPTAEQNQRLNGLSAAPPDHFDVIPDPVQIPDDSKPRRFVPIDSADFAEGPELAWLVKGVIPAAELVVIYGASGSGKSFFVLDLVAAVARGTQWRGLKTIKGKVIYICAEGAGGFRKRLRAYAHQHGIPLRGLLKVIGDAPNLLEKKDTLELTERVIAAGKAEVIVIDTLSAVAPGGNENTGEDMGVLLAHCKGLHRMTGAVVILIGHTGKDATRGMRGWTGIKAAADAELEVERHGEESACARTVTVTKQKDGEDGAAFGFRLVPVVLGTNADGDDVTSCVVEVTDVQPKAPKRAPLGPNETIVMAAVSDLALDGSGVDVEPVIDAARSRMIRGDERVDGRRKRAQRALESVQKKGLVRIAEGKIFPLN